MAFGDRLKRSPACAQVSQLSVIVRRLVPENRPL